MFFHTNAQEVKPINLLNPRVCFHRVYRVGMSTAMRCMYTKRAYIQQWGMYTVHRGHVYTIHWHVYCRGTCMPLMSRVFFFGNEGHSAKEALGPHRISLNIDQNTFLKEVTFMALSLCPKWKSFSISTQWIPVDFIQYSPFVKHSNPHFPRLNSSAGRYTDVYQGSWS